MRQGIVTKYLGPTNSRGGRIKAIARKRTFDGLPELSLTDGWDHGSHIDANHARVALMLATKLDWSGIWVGAGTPDESGYHWVNIGDRSTEAITAMRDNGTALGAENRDWFLVP